MRLDDMLEDVAEIVVDHTELSSVGNLGCTSRSWQIMCAPVLLFICVRLFVFLMRVPDCCCMRAPVLFDACALFV